MDIDLGSGEKFNVKYAGNTYSLREPMAYEIDLFGKQLKSSEGGESSAFIDLVVKMGMPKDIADSMGILTLKKLADKLVGELSGKK
jgi:hypothetical protein